MNASQKERIQETMTRYDVGDYKVARKLALELKDDTSLSKEDKAEVERVLKATGSDTVAIMAIVFSFCLLVFLVLKFAF